MFTGITQEIGTVKEVVRKRGIVGITITSKRIIRKTAVGSSILIDGICSTLVRKGSDWFVVQYMRETLRRSTAGSWNKGKKVNLEASLRFGDEIAGHLVMGHVDTTGIVENITSGRSDVLARICCSQAGRSLARFFLDKGSVAVNGVSLTVIKPRQRTFTVAFIPHTHLHTNLGLLKKYDTVNVEVDIMAKYAAQWITK